MRAVEFTNPMVFISRNRGMGINTPTTMYIILYESHKRIIANYLERRIAGIWGCFPTGAFVVEFN